MDQTKTNIPRVTSSKSNQHLWKLRTHLTGKKIIHLHQYCMQNYNDYMIYINISRTSTTSTTWALVHTECPQGKKAYIFSDLYQWPHEVNLTITVMLHLLHTMEVLPPTLYIRLDNCFRENKNQFMLGFCSLLVDIGVFKKVRCLHTYVCRQQCTKSNINTDYTMITYMLSCCRSNSVSCLWVIHMKTLTKCFHAYRPNWGKWSRNTDR